MRSNGPITLMLPAFRGLTRRIILTAVGVYAVYLVFSLFMPLVALTAAGYFMLRPETATHKLVWQFASYPFISFNLLGLALALLSFWFFGTPLEEERGELWFGEFFAVVTVGGGVLASLLTYAVAGRMAGLDPTSMTSGMMPAVMALVVAFAMRNPDATVRLNFLLPIKAKYMAAIYIGIYVVTVVLGGDRFGALTALCAALSGWAFLKWAPYKGLRFVVSEKWFGLRNSFYRAKRRRAAKKFTVYMKKQGKDVSIDPSGRYVDPMGTPRDPNDRKWMN